MAKNLVIVESPAKAKTIAPFLGPDYQALSSYGHIRDLKKHDFSVDIENNFAPIYDIPADKQQLVEDLKKAAAKAETVWLASDEDREGEAISWHLSEVLGLDPARTRRIVFHEITKTAILNAIQNPRTIDRDMVNAQQARRVLDRIVGFELSPVLWRKVKPALSAGRVQSVAVRLIVEREREIEKFQSEASYRVTGTFATQDASGQRVTFNAELNQRFKTLDEANNFLSACAKAKFVVNDVQQKPIHRSPAPPFTTSTLQQEAARKLRFSVSQTMSIAQRLYEAGQITYMRTDSVNLSTLCLGASKEQILKTLGEEYLHTRNFTTKTKGAQEAHEAIRPAYMDRPTIEGSSAEKRLYELIYKRTIASQMADALIEKTTVDIKIDSNEIDENLRFTADGNVIKFDGFLRVYIESTDEDEDGENNGSTNRLPSVKAGQALTLQVADALERFTQLPMRYSEASLVKKMEGLGIGRPSTYAPTISTIQQREYVEKGETQARKRSIKHLHLEGGKLVSSVEEENYGQEHGVLKPTDIGLVVNDYLTEHFPEIMSYNFTATVEDDFDKIAEGKTEWTKTIGEFYKLFHPLVTASLEERSDRKAGERVLGKDPKTGHTVSVKISRFGPVIQIGAQGETNKPQFAPLQKGQTMASITFEEALKLFELPKVLGLLNDKNVTLGVGRFGPYILHDGKYTTVPKNADLSAITFEDAVQLIEEKQQEEKKRIMRTFDEDPELQMLNGRFGPYLTKGGKNYKLPRNKDLEALSYEECLAIMEAADKAAAEGGDAPKRRFTRKKS